jgi:hypothetical protein
VLPSLIYARVIPLLDATTEKHLCHYVRRDLISTLVKTCYAAQYWFLFPWFWGACLQSGGQLLSKHWTQLTPNYKVTKENHTPQPVPFPSTLCTRSRGPQPPLTMAVRGSLHSFQSRTSLFCRREIWNSQRRRPKGFSSTIVNWNCVFPFSF